MTTGGPDTSDIFEEELNPANHRQYRYDGQWRDLTVRKETIAVKDGEKVHAARGRDLLFAPWADRRKKG